MDKIKKTLTQLWKDESGQGATEYILMLVVVVAIGVVFRDKIMDIVGKQTDAVGEKLTGAIANTATN